MKTFTFFLSMCLVVACLGTKAREEITLPLIEDNWEEVIDDLIIRGIDDAEEDGIPEQVLVMVESYRIEFGHLVENDKLRDYDSSWMEDWIQRGIDDLIEDSTADEDDKEVQREQMEQNMDLFLKSLEVYAEK